MFEYPSSEMHLFFFYSLCPLPSQVGYHLDCSRNNEKLQSYISQFGFKDVRRCAFLYYLRIFNCIDFIFHQQLFNIWIIPFFFLTKYYSKW